MIHPLINYHLRVMI